MDEVLYVLGYLNETHGFELVYPESVLKYREEADHFEIVVDRGVAGCPKFLIPVEVIDQWVEDHADDPVEDPTEIEDDEGFEDEATEDDDIEVVDPENGEAFEDDVENDDGVVEIDEPEDLTDLPGVGPKLEAALNTAGVHGVYDIMHGNNEYLLAIPGMSDMKLKRILEHIAEEERAA